jgi:hypothetical protein
MRTLLLFLTLASGTMYAQSPANSPLTPDEGRQVLGQLYELRSCREKSGELERYIERDGAQDAREKANSERALELEKQAAELARRERNLEKDRADTYERLYRSVTKKPGIGCRILMTITLGIKRCQ